MYNNRQIQVLLSDLSYEGKETVSTISELRYSRLPKANDGTRKLPFPSAKIVLVERISPTKARQVEFERFSEAYDQLIAEKYNMPLDWRQNRWFVEQVRPHL